MRYAIGIDVGGTNIRIAIVDEDGNLYDVIKQSTKAKNIEVRIPYVPTFNDTEIEKIALFLNELKNISRVRVLKYHNLAIDKYSALGLVYPLKNNPLPTDEDINSAIDVLKSYELNAMGSDD